MQEAAREDMPAFVALAANTGISQTNEALALLG